MGFSSDAGFFFPKGFQSTGLTGCRSEERNACLHQLHEGAQTGARSVSDLSGRVFDVFVGELKEQQAQIKST